MDDDIDIEEHDVLDNPRIRNIFPDINIIKAEVEDYIKEEDTSMDIEEDYHTYHSGPIVFEEDNNYKTFNNKIIIGSKPSTSTFQIKDTFSQEANFEESDFHGIDHQKTCSQETFSQETENQEIPFEEIGVPETNILQTLLEQTRFQNKIILGSKTSIKDSPNKAYSGDEDNVLLDVSVVLEDCKNFLENNPCFCNECKILFPTDNDFDAHKMTVHSFLVAVSKNKAVKSTTKHSIHNADIDCKNLICNHCNVVFPNTIALLRHSYELLPRKFACDNCDLVFKNDAALKAHKAKHNNKATKLTNSKDFSGMFVVCKICTCHFKWTTKLRTHMNRIHHTNEACDVQLEHSDLRCRLCDVRFYRSRGYNTHIQTYHTDYYYEKNVDVETISKFKCPQCNLSFSSDYSVRIHLAALHGQVGTVVDSKNFAFIKKEPVMFKKLTNIPAFSRHNKTYPLPKSILFKCNKCHIHFVSCTSAVLHSRTCVSKKGDFKCDKCRRTFNSQDKIHHCHQHSISEKFKVIEIGRNILNRILCKCRTCKNCFDEKSFMTYHTEACQAGTPAIHCTECNLWIHAKAMAVHKKIHASGVTAKDFIITYYVHAEIPINEPEDSGSEEKFEMNTSKYKLNDNRAAVKFKATKLAKTKGLVKQKTKSDEMSHFYCPTCKCFMKMNKITDKHYIGQCNTSRPSLTCKSCGLRFTHKALQRHSNLHKKYPKLKLKDLKFINIQTKRRINPPFPNFKKCNLCDVTFFSVLALKNHACNAEEPKICAYCDKKFSDLTYNLHMQYHEYPSKSKMNQRNSNLTQETNKMSEINKTIPELIKKYRSLKQIWNILFLCKTCDIVIDSYDNVVEHCQDHFCNMESYNVTIKHCNICDLNFVDECFKKHKELHLSDVFDRDSFKILEYKYENLLSDSWLEIFATLTKEQIDLILSKSMYKFTRCVRMKAVSNVRSNLTLYQCGKCKYIVAPNRVAEHSQIVKYRCESARSFSCLVCKLRFAYKSHKIAHENLHEFRKLNAKSFRIIQFHAEKQFSTELKHNEVDEINMGEDEQKEHPDGLKFIRCQHCGKLINKHKYKTHIKYHHYCGKSKAKIDVSANKKIVYNFYKCKDCKLCVCKNTVKRHTCERNYSRKKCPKCPLWFRSQNLASHYKHHEKFSRNNMNIIYFEKGVILKQSNKNLLVGSNKFYNKGLTNKKSFKINNTFVGTNKFHNKALIYYQCSECTMCIWHKANINRHACSSVPSRVTCEKCGITCLTSRKLAHEKMHSIRNFNRKNIMLIQFTDRKIINTKSTNTVAQKRKPQSTHEETVVKKPRIDRTFNKNKANTVYEASEPAYKRTFVKRPRICLEKQRPSPPTQHSESVIKGISLKQSIRNSRCPMHNIYYKCKTCKLLFVTGTGLIEHENVCNQNREAKKCNVCGFVFHASEIELHNKTQRCSNNMENVYLLKMQQIGKSYNIARNWLYRCSQCDIHYMCYNSWTYHFKRNHNTLCAIISCEICNIKCTTMTFKKHLNVHHGRKKFLFSDLNIVEVENTSLALKDLPNDKHVVYVDTYTAKKTPELAVNDYEDKPEVNVNANQINTVIKCSSDPKSSAYKTTKIQINETGVYHCDVCGLNFVHPRSLERHKSNDKHDEVHYSCPKCNLSFTRISLKKHTDIHHSETKVKRKFTNNKTDLNDSVIESIPRMFYDDQPNTSSIEDNQPSKNDSKNESSVYGLKIHNNIMKNNIINNHENVRDVGVISKSEISSNFQNQTNTSSNLINTVVDPIPVNASKVNNKPFNAEEYNISAKSTPKPVDELETVSKNHIDPRNSKNVENKPNTVPNETNTALNKNKLFKCSICDVYFLTANDCYEHTVSHTQLHTTEFIACKICDLQFCCEFLGRHMKSHREKTFSVDDLIVVEYHPNDSGDFITDTYLAMDRLKTKLVSTTTHFDTEDEKSACVDSTTTENVCIDAQLSSPLVKHGCS